MGMKSNKVFSWGDLLAMGIILFIASLPKVIWPNESKPMDVQAAFLVGQWLTLLSFIGAAGMMRVMERLLK